jgi:hypothetical protein
MYLRCGCFFLKTCARAVSRRVKGVMLRAGSFKRRFLRERDEGQRGIFDITKKEGGVLFDFDF